MAANRIKVLLVDDDADFREELRRMLVSNGINEIETADNALAALKIIEQGDVGLVLLDMVMPGISGTELLSILGERYPALPVIMITAVSDAATIVGCIKQGAMDYLTKPLDAPRLYATVTRSLQFSELKSQNRQLRDFLLGEPLLKPEVFAAIVTGNSRMKAIFKFVETVAVTDNPVLITGETGVGKESMARAVHDASGLKGEFVAVNVAGLDDLMFSDTLFGHRKGAFTGASDSREGLIKKAEGGTLFLDEIGDLRQDSQKMLLRLLQEREYYRLGSDLLFKSSARIVAASNRDFKAAIAAGTFRSDLFHRLATHELHIPPLRERADDIPLLTQHFVMQAAEALGKPVTGISPEARRALAGCEFPGNIRELQNLIKNAVAFNRSGELTLADFPALKAHAVQSRGVLKIATEGGFTLQAAFDSFPRLDEVELLLVQEALMQSSGNKLLAAELLGISRPTLNKKLADVEGLSAFRQGDKQ